MTSYYRTHAVGLAALYVIVFNVECFGAGPETPLMYKITEECDIGTLVADLRSDAGLSTSRHSDPEEFILLNRETPYFDLHSSLGILRTKGRVDRDVICPGRENCTLSADFVVKSHRPMDVRKVLVEVEDINDNSPKFPKDFLDINVPESLAPGQLSLLINPASDSDSPRNGIKSYHLEPAEDEHNQPFYLVQRQELAGSVELRLELRHPVDRERRGYYRLKVIATDGGNVCRSGSVVVGVSIVDENDNSPRFVNATYDVEITENAPPRDDLVVVRATDPDIGNNGKVVYSLSDDSRTRYGSLFAIDAATGVVSQLLAINFEEHNEPIHLEVIARDAAAAAAAAGGMAVGSSSSATALVVITVRDENDNVPSIEIEVETENEGGFSSKRYKGEPVNLRIKEHGPINRVLAALSVEDADSGNAGRVHCSMPSSHFHLTAFYDNEYQVTTGPGELDRELQDRYRLVITCNDMGQPVRSSSAIIYVIVDDINDNDPQFSETVYSWTVVENQSIGDVIGRVTATDQDIGANGEVTYRLIEGPSHLISLNSTNGDIRIRSKFDRETSPTVRFLIHAVDNGSVSRTSTATVDITVKDIDDETPRFTKDRFVFQVRENSPPATEVGRPTAEDRDVDPSYNRMSFYLDTSSSGANDDVGRLFRVDPDSGIIYTRQPLDREECSVYNMTIAVNSLSSSHKSVDLCYVTVNVLDVNDCAPIVIFPSATSNDSVRISALNTDNGNGPIATVIAVDRDIGANAKLSYNIAKWKYATSESAWRSEEEQRWHSGSGQFVINSTTGAINVLRTDTLDGAAIKLLITVRDGGDPSLTSSAVLTVFVIDNIQMRQSNYGNTFLSQPLGGVSLAALVAGLAGSLVLVALMIVATVVARRNRKYGHARRSHSSSREHVTTTVVAEPQWSRDPRMTSPSDPASSSLQRCAVLAIDDLLEESDDVINGELVIMDTDLSYGRGRSATMTSYDEDTRRTVNQTRSSSDQLNLTGAANPRTASLTTSILMTSQPSPKLSTFANNWPTQSPTHSNGGAASRHGTLERRMVRFKEDFGLTTSKSSDLTDSITSQTSGSFLGSLPPPPPPLAIDSYGEISYTSPYRLPFPCNSAV